jgi:hypothetical protein
VESRRCHLIGLASQQWTIKQAALAVEINLTKICRFYAIAPSKTLLNPNLTSQIREYLLHGRMNQAVLPNVQSLCQSGVDF